MPSSTPSPLATATTAALLLLLACGGDDDAPDAAATPDASLADAASPTPDAAPPADAAAPLDAASPVDASAPTDAALADAGPPDAGPPEDWHRGSTATYDGSGELDLERPTDTAPGDLLVLFLSRTDDLLPVALDGWDPVASCFKTDNGQPECFEVADCIEPDGDYCRRFAENGGGGRDLATVAFLRTVAADEPARYAWTLRGSRPAWAILTGVRGADPTEPVRDEASTSNDRSTDSVFPSATGEPGDFLLLAQAFDDTTDEADFLPPDGTELFRWIAGPDEAGYVFGAQLDASGPTGERPTGGPGGPRAKDLTITLVLAAR